MSGKVTITINGRNFPIHCNPGDEERVKELGQYVDEKARDLAKDFSGKINDLHLMVMVSLLIADELRDAVSANERLEQELEAKSTTFASKSEDGRFADASLVDPRLSDPHFMKAVEMLASRMENIAENIQQR